MRYFFFNLKKINFLKYKNSCIKFDAFSRRNCPLFPQKRGSEQNFKLLISNKINNVCLLQFRAFLMFTYYLIAKFLFLNNCILKNFIAIIKFKKNFKLLLKV